MRARQTIRTTMFPSSNQQRFISAMPKAKQSEYDEYEDELDYDELGEDELDENEE